MQKTNSSAHLIRTLIWAYGPSLLLALNRDVFVLNTATLFHI